MIPDGFVGGLTEGVVLKKVGSGATVTGFVFQRFGGRGLTLDVGGDNSLLHEAGAHGLLADD